MDDSAGWPKQVAVRLGEAVKSARESRGISYVKLAEATELLGAPVHRVAIPRIEKGEQGVTVPELIALGVALEADWSKWLDRATAGIEMVIPGAKSDRAFLRKFIADLDEELERQRHSLFQEEEGPKHLSIPQQYVKTLADQAAQRRKHIETLEKQRARYAAELARLDHE
ncbi:hypothetical protein NJB1507_05110 [Mycobacterium marinum]|uniref:helix-turn-helix domain-containing protein n=1 Tax=Mycobacterium marinum TaxID=1781 RepID=UPI0021C32FD3|nr:helix-turn-helix transcriptional regulator [Mycobacterium marinum]GJO16736.1 hypothetical protein NJB1507_05110 [Mycobacterium marinum]